MAERRGVYRVLVEKPDGREHFEDTDIDESIILR
jgi:hypothetical protein